MKGGLDWRWGFGLLMAVTWGCAGSVPVSSPVTLYHVLYAPNAGGDHNRWAGGAQPGGVDIYSARTNLVTYDLSGPAIASSSQAGFGADRATDEDWNTEWASGGYRTRWAALDLNFQHPNHFGRVVIKTGKTDGDYYVIQAWDGREWVDASQRIQNRDWQPHSYSLQLPPRTSRLRVLWVNDHGTTDHASIFGIAVFPERGGGGEGPGGPF
ncbi:MAG TPA: hypothetical protein V6D47_12225 [Oscillatoriaceae cyanobacterium]